jgi:hypothetical protein
MRPMTSFQALEEMVNVGHDFYAFRNAESGKLLPIYFMDPFLSYKSFCTCYQIVFFFFFAPKSTLICLVLCFFFFTPILQEKSTFCISGIMVAME